MTPPPGPGLGSLTKSFVSSEILVPISSPDSVLGEKCIAKHLVIFSLWNKERMTSALFPEDETQENNELNKRNYCFHQRGRHSHPIRSFTQRGLYLLCARPYVKTLESQNNEAVSAFEDPHQ